MGKQEEKTVAEAQISQSVNLADLVAALKAATGNDEDSIRTRARIQAEEAEKLREWENRWHPEISAFSYPEGDRKHKKPALKCRMSWNGHIERPESLTPEEIEAYNLSKPGEYPFKRTDGTHGMLTVIGKTGPAGDLQSLEFTFPCRLATDSMTLKPKAEMLREALGLPSETDALRAELEALKAQKKSA